MIGSTGIRIKACIELLASTSGGRMLPVRGSYRPNHNFGGPNSHEFEIGFLDFPEGEFLSPGESKEMEITLWMRSGLVESISPGKKWRIQEGHQLMGFGIVLEVLPD